MENNRELSPREKEITNRNYSKTGGESRENEIPQKEAGKRESSADRHRADINGNVGRFETERTYPVSDSSAAPGAEENADIGTAASGAGFGGNKGTGTRNKKDFT